MIMNAWTQESLKTDKGQKTKSQTKNQMNYDPCHKITILHVSKQTNKTKTKMPHTDRQTQPYMVGPSYIRLGKPYTVWDPTVYHFDMSYMGCLQLYMAWVAQNPTLVTQFCLKMQSLNCSTWTTCFWQFFRWLEFKYGRARFTHKYNSFLTI